MIARVTNPAEQLFDDGQPLLTQICSKHALHELERGQFVRRIVGFVPLRA